MPALSVCKVARHRRRHPDPHGNATRRRSSATSRRGMGVARGPMDPLRSFVVTRANDWWENAVVYQLLVPSFADSDGDGYGDLAGVIERLDYLEWLGIDALWLSPIYRSPFRELGYDVADYYDVDPRFGSLETFDALVDEAHRR